MANEIMGNEIKAICDNNALILANKENEEDENNIRHVLNAGLPIGKNKLATLVMPYHRIPRPSNAFMIFANEHRKILAKKYIRESNKEISCRLGKMWRELEDEVKGKYHGQAKILDLEHKRKYPDYVYNPREARLRKLARRQRTDTTGNDISAIIGEPSPKKKQEQEKRKPMPCLNQIKRAKKESLREQVLRGLALDTASDKRAVGYFIASPDPQQAIKAYQTYMAPAKLPVRFVKPVTSTITTSSNYPSTTVTWIDSINSNCFDNNRDPLLAMDDQIASKLSDGKECGGDVQSFLDSLTTSDKSTKSEPAIATSQAMPVFYIQAPNQKRIMSLRRPTVQRTTTSQPISSNSSQSTTASSQPTCDSNREAQSYHSTDTLYTPNGYGNLPWGNGHVFYTPVQDFTYNTSYACASQYQPGISFASTRTTSSEDDVMNFAVTQENDCKSSFGQILSSSMQILDEEGKGLDPMCQLNYEMVENGAAPSGQMAKLDTATCTTAAYY